MCPLLRREDLPTDYPQCVKSCVIHGVVPTDVLRRNGLSPGLFHLSDLELFMISLAIALSSGRAVRHFVLMAWFYSLTLF